MSPPIKALIPVFPGYNTLDVNGPLEVLGSSAIAQQQLFHTDIASAAPETPAFENTTILSTLPFHDLLADNGAKLAEYDLLIIPGGPPDKVQAAIDAGGNGLLELIKLFVSQGKRRPRQRWLVSICTGAGFLAVCGLLGGKTVTAHWGYLERLCELSDTASREFGLDVTTVVRKRWVDAGIAFANVHLVTAGGVSCGIDCMLWVQEQLVGEDVAKKVALAMDYGWSYRDIEVTRGHL